jgi:hypothetical protein
MVDWDVLGEMLRFKNLDSYPSCDVYATFFRLSGAEADAWTKKLMDFKDGYSHAVTGACALLDRVLPAVQIQQQPVTIVSAIPSSAERLPPDHFLHRVGAVVAARLGGTWRPDILRKSVHESRHKNSGLSLGQRTAIVTGVYVADTVPEKGTVVIVDDVITSGGTLRDASRAILKANPKLTTIGVAMSKTDRRSFLGERVNNDHITPETAKVWP